jgi:hypothetical protein
VTTADSRRDNMKALQNHSRRNGGEESLSVGRGESTSENGHSDPYSIKGLENPPCENFLVLAVY